MSEIAVVASEYYLPPRELPPTAWDLIPPAERVIAWWEHRAQRRLPRREGIDLSVTLWARIDAGRWVAQCPCGSAQVVDPQDPRYFCPECLGGWYQVVFPADVPAAEATVAGLPPHERFWRNPDEPEPTPPPPPPVKGGA